MATATKKTRKSVRVAVAARSVAKKAPARKRGARNPLGDIIAQELVSQGVTRALRKNAKKTKARKTAKNAKKRTIVKATVIKKVVINSTTAALRKLTDANLLRITRNLQGQIIDFGRGKNDMTQKGFNSAVKELKRRGIFSRFLPNPSPNTQNLTPARKKFEQFQGRPAGKVVTADVSSLAKGQKLYAIGPLKEIKVKGYGVLKPAAKSFLLADTRNKLWISEKIGKPQPGTKASALERIGEIEHVVYHARKPHIEADKWQDFIHKLGEETGKRPVLYMDPQGYAVIKGGAYTIESRGIVN